MTWFGNAIRQGRLTGSLLFVGPGGVGKQTTALLLAQTLLCESTQQADQGGLPDPCGACPGCIQVVAGTHPDLVVLSKPADKSMIPLDKLIGPPDARMQEGFCREVRLKPSRGKRKVAILNDADFLNEEGANCLLKTLEEPPPGSLIILIGTSEQRQLPTIRSRCRIIRFQPPAGQDAVRFLRTTHGVTASDEEVDRAVQLAAGDLQVALRMLQDEDNQWRQGFIDLLNKMPLDPVAVTRSLTARVDAAGKEASKRRDALRDTFSIAIQTYRQTLRQKAADASVANDQTTGEVIRRMDRCVRAIREVDRSANQSTLIECFASDLADAVTADRGAIGS